MAVIEFNGGGVVEPVSEEELDSVRAAYLSLGDSVRAVEVVLEESEVDDGLVQFVMTHLERRLSVEAAGYAAKSRTFYGDGG